jgi:ATP-dependent HslUV protease ATP-binding subunit HslU
VKRGASSEVGFNSGSSDTDQELNEKTRERFREKLRNGELDDRKIELEVSSRSSMPTMQIFGPAGLEEMGINLQNMLGGLGGGGKKKKRQVKIGDAREMLLAEEAEKLIDHDAAVSEALERVQSSGIVFVDEIDKIAGGTSGDGRSSADVSRQGVQRDLLPIVEGSTISTKYGLVKTDHILFIASGAFHVAKPSDLIPELQGRFPIRVEMSSLTEEDFFNILTSTDNALIKQYQAMLEAEGVSLTFTDEAIREIASIAAEVNSTVEDIGARRLHTILSTVLEDLMFAIPDDIKQNEITIDKDFVGKQLDEIRTDRDLSQYIL